jgi:hypothetical protein
MNLELIESVLASPTAENIQALLDDEATVFWVDWRQEDESIAESCETILQTGALSGELVNVATGEGFEVYLNYRGQRHKVPLTYSGADRHVALCALNDVLRPEYEIRFCIDSHGSDTLAFLPLASDQWADLEHRYGDAVGQRFYQFAASPNLFTDPVPFEPVVRASTESAGSTQHCAVAYQRYDQPLDLTGKDEMSLLNAPKAKVAALVGPLAAKSEMPMAQHPTRELTSMTGEIADEVHEFPNATLGTELSHLVLHFLNDRLVGIRWTAKGRQTTPPPRPWFRRWLGL